MAATHTLRRAHQQSVALERAHHVRRERSRLKGRIARGELSVQQVLLACPSHATTMPVGDLLMSQRWWGSARCHRLLVSVGVSERKPVGNLTERQRTAMAAVLMLRG